MGPAFAHRFVARQTRRKKWGVAASFEGWFARFGERAHPALATLLDAAGEAKAAARVVPELLPPPSGTG